MEKLNYRRTFFIGLAFLSICAFWQMYDNVIPLILQNTFHLNETFTGAIMAADNILAVFLLHSLEPCRIRQIPVLVKERLLLLRELVLRFCF